MAPPLKPVLPDGGIDVPVSAIPEDLTSYSRMATQSHQSLAGPAATFTRAMMALRGVAGTADARIPKIIGASIEEREVVEWLAAAEENDRWVATVAQAFTRADAADGTPLLGPLRRVTVTPGALSLAMEQLAGKEPGDGLKIVDGKLVGPGGELFPIFVPPLTDGNTLQCLPEDPGKAYNADHFLTPDDPTSAAQTRNGGDPGWVVVGEPSVGMTSVNPPSKLDILAAIVAPELGAFGEPAGPGEYKGLLEQLAGEGGGGDEEGSQPGGLPPDNPFLDSRDHYTPPPGVPMPDMGRQETVNAGVGAVVQVTTSLGNVVHVKNGALAAYHATFERNVDGETRAVVRLYTIGTPPGGSDPVTHAYYGGVGDDGKLKYVPLQVKPPPPGVSMGPP